MKTFFPLPATLALTAIIVSTGCSKHSASPAGTQPPAAEQTPPPPPGVSVFNSFGPQDSVDKSVAWAVMNDGAAGYRGQAEWFVPSTSGAMNGIDLAMSGKGTLKVTVAENQNGLPGKPLEQFLKVRSPQSGKSGHLVVVSVAHPVLQAGTKYWLCAEPADASTGCAWSYNNQNLAQGFAFERGPGGWSAFSGGMRDGAFRITVVP